ncbi:MAG: AAA family ATPase [Ammonifex sp.]|nr:MAG: AAA family ATPase [Ammonifex sp.]
MADACQECGDRGLILRGDAAVPCKCVKEKAVRIRFLQAHITPLMRECLFDRFTFKYYSRTSRDKIKGITYYDSAKRAYDAARDFVTSFLSGKSSEGLIFVGEVGTGKTFLACCIANAVLASGQEVLLVNVPDFLDEIRATYDVSSDMEHSEHELLGLAKGVPLLILDDLGAFIYTEWARQKIYSILNHRLNHCMPVIITTNVALEELEEYLGERTTSRLFEMCRTYRIYVDHDIRAVRREKPETGHR